MAKLFTSFKCKDLELKNRIVMPPMCMYSAAEDGKVTPWHIVHYASRAQGGVGLIIQEATGVQPNGRITANDLGIWSDEHLDGLKSIADIVHSYGTKIGIQLNHAGRKCTVPDARVVAPSAIAFSKEYRTPEELTVEEIHDIVKAFRDAARRAYQAGYDAIEIHGAHGYLISEFLSPLTNHRTDDYGGSKENRMRFLKEVVETVREVWPMEKPLIVRISASDYQMGGNQPEDLALMLNLIKHLGIDLVNVSSGGVVLADIRPYAGYQVPFAEVIREQTGLPVIAGGLIRSPYMAEEIIASQRADLVYIGRSLLDDPYWPLHADAQLDQELDWPRQYERGKPRRTGYSRDSR